MAKAKGRELSRRRVSLTVRLSLLVLFAALLPLAAVVGINDYFSRGTLIDQSRTALKTDASTKVSLLDTYLHERELDVQALATLVTTPPFVACASPSVLHAFPPELSAALTPKLDCAGASGTGTTGLPFYEGSNTRALAVGLARDSNYTVWSIYDGHGKLLLTKNAPGVTTTPSALVVPQEDLAQVMQHGKEYISPVYYDPKANHAYVHIYTPVTLAPLSQLGISLPAAVANIPFGFLDATLNIDYIWNQVKTDVGANGAGSYAFITDENGVRIADTQSGALFTAIAPLNTTAQQIISTEQRFGTSSAIKVNGLPSQYQYVQIHMTTVPWTYYVLSPLSTVTAVADTQLRVSLLSAGVIAVLAILIGLFIGTRTTRPVQASTTELEGAAVALKLLASRQESSASEQQWVVDACRTGLDSVRYLSDAMNQAARRIIDASNWFSEYWDRLTEEQAKRTVAHLLELARYIDEAARRQNASSERLGKAITVTIQVSDQLVAGAAAATSSAEQLEQVVFDLHRVVGGRINPIATEDVEQMTQMANEQQMMTAAANDPYRGSRSGRLDLPPAQMQRQIAAPANDPLAALESWQRAPRAPRAPYSVPGSQRSGDSQLYPGGYDEYDGYGGQQPDPWANARPGAPANRPSQFWGDR